MFDKVADKITHVLLVFALVLVEFLVLVVGGDVGDLLNLGRPDDDGALKDLLLLPPDRDVLDDLLRQRRGCRRHQQRPQQQHHLAGRGHGSGRVTGQVACQDRTGHGSGQGGAGDGSGQVGPWVLLTCGLPRYRPRSDRGSTPQFVHPRGKMQ